SALIASVTRNIGVAVNSGLVAAQAVGGPTRMLAQPVASSSAVSASFGSSNTFPAFAPTGQFYSSAGTSLQIYTPPFTNASTPSSTITFPIGISSVAVDSAGNIYINNGSTGIAAATSGGTITANITIAGKFYREMVLSSTQLFACNISGGTGSVDVFTLPLTNASTPAFSITAVNGPEGCALDSTGNLYVANVNDGTISRFAAPFSGSSTANLTLTVVNPNTDAIFGIAIGP
ncbi:MAG TPA: hypothetical protein VFB22_04255, partial [Candidatus Baltobacteraceae bacterium]|nr:hypothetical protein [Candidatus Baltobacteraceae bacterium]